MHRNAEQPASRTRSNFWIPAAVGDLFASLVIAGLCLCATAAFLMLYSSATTGADHNGESAITSVVGLPAPVGAAERDAGTGAGN